MPIFPTDIRIEHVTSQYEDYLYRVPIKFGGMVLDRVTLLNVWVKVATGAGKVANGFGSMPLGNVWSFPSRTLTYGQTLAAMKCLADKFVRLFGEYPDFGHPLDIAHALETEYRRLAREVEVDRKSVV